MYIGELAKLTGVSRKAIRHYELLGLLPEPKRKGCYRVYGETDVKLICTIKTAQSLGFSLKEMAGVVSARTRSQKLPVELVIEMIDAKRIKLRSAIDDARTLDTQLEQLRSRLLRNYNE